MRVRLFFSLAAPSLCEVVFPGRVISYAALSTRGQLLQSPGSPSSPSSSYLSSWAPTTLRPSLARPPPTMSAFSPVSPVSSCLVSRSSPSTVYSASFSFTFSRVRCFPFSSLLLYSLRFHVPLVQTSFSLFSFYYLQLYSLRTNIDFYNPRR